MLLLIMNIREQFKQPRTNESLRRKSAERVIALGATAVAAVGLGTILYRGGNALVHDADDRFHRNGSHSLNVVPNLEIFAGGLLELSALSAEVIGLTALFPAAIGALNLLQDQRQREQ